MFLKRLSIDIDVIYLFCSDFHYIKNTMRRIIHLMFYSFFLGLDVIVKDYFKTHFQKLKLKKKKKNLSLKGRAS